MKNERFLKIISTLIAVMFFYAASSKLLDYDRSREEMLNQVFPRLIAELFVWLVPLIELIVTFLLLLNPLRLYGFVSALLLMVMFSIYIAITMSGAFGRIPCACGGILGHLGYWLHLIFNMAFILLAIAGIMLEKNWTSHRVFTSKRERRSVKLN